MKKSTKQKSVSKSAHKKSGVQPLGDRVLIRPAREEEKRIGSLIIPATGEREKPDTGIVLAVGEGRWVNDKLVPVRVRIGDRVMFSKYSYDEVKIDGEELYIMREEHVLAVLG